MKTKYLILLGILVAGLFFLDNINEPKSQFNDEELIVKKNCEENNISNPYTATEKFKEIFKNGKRVEISQDSLQIFREWLGVEVE